MFVVTLRIAGLFDKKSDKWLDIISFVSEESEVWYG